MKRLLCFFGLLILCTNGVEAQKLVIGSKVSEIRTSKEVQWLSAAPVKGQALLVEFFSSTNPSSVAYYADLAAIEKTYREKLEIVVLSRTTDDDLRAKIVADGAKYSFGLDSDGDVFDMYSVRYLPFTMLFNAKNELLWQGNLSTLTAEVLEQIR